MLTLTAFAAAASAADLSYPPRTSGGHDFNHAPIGQSFTAGAGDVYGGIFLADHESFASWVATVYPGFTPGSYPYSVAPSVTVRIDLLAGEGVDGEVLHSTTRTLTAPFMDFVDVDYGSAGITLTPGNSYTLLLTDVSGQSYPFGVTGWVVPSVCAPTTSGYLPPGAYDGGRPILKGVLVSNDAGIGDNSFHVMEYSSAPPPTPDPLSISGTAVPAGTVGILYSADISVEGGVPPYIGTASGLPAGLKFEDLKITGTPLVSGVSAVTITVQDAAGDLVCANMTLMINPAVPSNYTIVDESKGKITAIGVDYVMAGRKKLIWNANTIIIVNTPNGERHVIDSFVKVGMRVQWKGLRDPATGTVLTAKLEIN